MSWLYRIYCIENIDTCSPEISDSMKKFQKKLTSILYDTYTLTRINQLFNIIIGMLIFYLLALILLNSDRVIFFTKGRKTFMSHSSKY